MPGSRASSLRDSKPAPPTSPKSRRRQDDFRPFVFRTTDFGATWTRISSGLPGCAEATSIVEDTVNPNLLFLGTSAGVFVSFDRGANWVSFRSNMGPGAGHGSAGASARGRSGGGHLRPRRLGHQHRPAARHQSGGAFERCRPASRSAPSPSATKAASAITVCWATVTRSLPMSRMR